jgi:hypothetical protein
MNIDVGSGGENSQLGTDLLSTSRYQDAFAWLATACWQQVCSKLSTDLLQVVINRLDASCRQQTWYKLSRTDLMQVVTNRLDASCHEQTAWCKLSRTDLMQVVANRLDASCELQAWCKLSSTDLMQVVKMPSEESALWSFVYALFWTKTAKQVAIFRL